MSDYWSSRIRDAQLKARNAPSKEICEVYYQLCEHYQAMDELSPIPRHQDRPSPYVSHKPLSRRSFL